MKQRLLYGVVTLGLALNLLVGARVYLASAEGAEKDSPYPNLELFSYVMERVRKDYVDGDTLTYKELVYGALKGMLNSLDPHSEFMEPAKLKDLQDDTQGAFGGLGIVISMRDEYVTVVAPMDDSPGFRAGILSGDRIMQIDGQDTADLTVDDAKQLLRGKPGSKVTLTVFRPTSNETKEFKMTREEIKVDMVKDLNGKREFPLDENKIGYVRLVQFGEHTGEELAEALNKMKSKGMTGLILDLRWNPGGLLEEAVEVCEKFLPRGQLVVSTEGRGNGQNQQRRAMGKGDAIAGIPVIVLVNLGSASASEIVAGCLQDLKRATVLGEKTFGKGSVQSIVQLPDGSALRLTTAKYYTPSHKVIHEHGITPDIVVPLSDEEERSVLILRSPGGAEGYPPEERQKILQAKDPQLQRAVETLRGGMLFSERLGGDEKRMAAEQPKADGAEP